MKSLHQLISNIEPPNWVMAILGFTVILRVPSFFAPYYYGDEMIYLVLGNAVRHGITLYSQIHDNKPPLIYLLGALAGNLFWFRAILMFWMIATIIAFYHLAKLLFEKNTNAQKISVIVFALLTTLPLFEGQIVNAELFLIGPIILSIYIILKNPNTKNIFIGGILFAIAALFKVPAIFDIGVLVIYWLITSKLTIKNSLILFLGFIIPILLSFAWYIFQHAGADYLKSAFLENVGYISSWGGSKNSFVVTHGPLFIKAGIIIIAFIILRLYHIKLTRTFLIATIWLLTSLFAVTLSGRPYPHYMIQSVPALALLIGILVTSAKFEQVLTIIPLTLTALALVYYHFWYYPTLPYYSNFVKFATQNESKQEYFLNIDHGSLVNYETSKIITSVTSQNDKIFVWGEEAPTIYALTKRLPSIKYVADYHITDFSSLTDNAKILNQNPPTLIVLLPGSKIYKELNELLDKKYILINNSGSSAEIWHLQTN
ncbi:hypothetical protein BH10PAT1_BH10PAT1_3710 [soil metagenome]